MVPETSIPSLSTHFPSVNGKALDAVENAMSYGGKDILALILPDRLQVQVAPPLRAADTPSLPFVPPACPSHAHIGASAPPDPFLSVIFSISGSLQHSNILSLAFRIR